MNRKKRISLCLALLLLCNLAVAGYAQGESEGTVIRLASAEDLVLLAKNCRTDTYSENLTVILERDIDLGQEPFLPIPVFCGVFEGNGHSITGFVLGEDGSHQGLFRYVQEGAVVRGLHLVGDVRPDNSRCQVGGLVGVNRGTIEGCTFEGTVVGLNDIGGIAGLNYGIIENCTAQGTVNGKRFTGGICGYSEGILTNCLNHAAVNTEITEGTLELNNLNITNITDAFSFIHAEDTDVVSDTGGIVGFSKGIITFCENSGPVGYPRYGYNVGGICGRQSGYLSSCVNHANIYGKKDIGGIVGQMQPYLLLKDSRALADELNYLTALLARTIDNLNDSAQNVGAALNLMQGYMSAAVGEISAGLTLPTEPIGTDPSAWEIYWNQLEAINSEALAADLEGLTSDLAYLNAALRDGASLAAEDLKRVNAESNRVVGMVVDAISGKYSVTLYEDISDTMTEENKDGRVSLCINKGNVSGDTNVGGIAGAMAQEYEFDMDDTLSAMLEEYVDTSSIVSSTFQSQCVSAGNQNRGTITAKKDNAGGITGFADVGTVTLCENYGNVSSTDGGYVGGVAGRSATSVYQSYAMCSLDGAEYVGGIAGYGTRIRWCRTIVDMDDVTACYGAIAGYADVSEPEQVADNRFVSEKLGAIDGINYRGYAEPESYEELLAEGSMPKEFVSLKLVFKADGETIKEIPFAYGDSIPQSEIPAVPEKAGYTAAWEPIELTNMTVGQTVEAIYTAKLTAIATEQCKEGTSLPLVILEGNFAADTAAEAEPFRGQLPETENGTVLEAWTLKLDSGREKQPEEYTVRYYAPSVTGLGHELEIWRLREDGTWEKAETNRTGSYQVFDGIKETGTFAAVDVQHKENESRMKIIAAAAAGLLVLLVVVLLIRRSRKKTRNAKHTAAN